MKLFYSYAHEDEDLRQELEKHLSTLRREGLIEDWHDRKIAPGSQWTGQIDEHLETADVILLLVSSDFLASDYCWDVEMKRALQRHAQGTARVISVILRHCDWHSSPFGKLQALPTDARPVKDWPDRDAAWTEIAHALRKIAQTRYGKSPSPFAPQAPVIPHGLKSFDADDTDFFLQLLPGPYHANGLPESLHFWKRQVERTDADETFRVGVIYGRSGCGKSSWIKAGLLPRLENVTAVYIEATPNDTPTRLLAALRKRCPWLRDAASLADALSDKARIPAETKVLVVLDQFEQWLHGRLEEEYGELLAALSSCDGAQVQCVLLIRSDFWDLLTRFLDHLEVKQEQGRNLAMFDLFHKRHARHVLTLFGQAHGALPRDGELSAEHEAFLTAAVDGLAEDGRIVCVRLSLFAEMLKGREWTPATLKQLGGTSGVGFAFLEENFSSKYAPLQYRRHEAAARAVLECLLPPTGTDIKGAMRSEDELRQKSGYERKPEDFADLLEILNQKLRLITPTAVLVEEPGAASVKNYQLTHDYLVPSLRDWLTAKQRETWRGRAMLILTERADSWTAKPEDRQLPNSWEFANVVLLTRMRSWTPTQQRMMRAAVRYFGVHCAMAIVLIVISAVAWQSFNARGQRTRAEMAVNGALNAPAAATFPSALNDVISLRHYARSILEERCNATGRPSGKANDGLNPNQHLRCLCALAALGDVRIEELVRHVTHEPRHPPGECDNIIVALRNSSEAAIAEIRKQSQALPVKKETLRARSRLAVVAFHLGNSEWADAMCSPAPDPTARTAFIVEFRSWHGSLASLAKKMNRQPVPMATTTLSALCLCAGSLPQGDLTIPEINEWKPILEEWFVTHPDSGVHSAAGWAMRQWQIHEPNVPASEQPDTGREWFVTKHGLTLIRMLPGRVSPNNNSSQNANSQAVSLDHELWMSDREISIELFREFLDDVNYANKYPDTRLADLMKQSVKSDWRSEAPMSHVTWMDAARFCNWMSRREGRSEYYMGTADSNDRDWRFNDSAEGYRLPFGNEWEYACRAGSSTNWASGNNDQMVREYAVNNTTCVQPCGIRMSNPRGFFDMHGNVWEWCQDRRLIQEVPQNVVTPTAPPADFEAMIRGGSWYTSVQICQSWYTSHYSTSYSANDLGFRVACKPASGAIFPSALAPEATEAGVR